MAKTLEERLEEQIKKNEERLKENERILKGGGNKGS